MSPPPQHGHVLFNSFEDLEAASHNMRAKNHAYGDAGVHPEGRRKTVWLDIAKTGAEQRPTRMVHQAAQWITELEKAPNPGGTVTKKMNLKGMSANGDTVGQTLNGVWKWYSAAHRRYTPEELEDTKLAIDSAS